MISKALFLKQKSSFCFKIKFKILTIFHKALCYRNLLFFSHLRIIPYLTYISNNTQIYLFLEYILFLYASVHLQLLFPLFLMSFPISLLCEPPQVVQDIKVTFMVKFSFSFPSSLTTPQLVTFSLQLP